jgi:hypothetical protein
MGGLGGAAPPGCCTLWEVLNLDRWLAGLKGTLNLWDALRVELTTLVNKLFEYIQAGTGILNFFVPFDVIRPAIDVFLAVWAVEHAYQLVLWVLRKVPIIGIK